ncbi:50S ribosomal protein L29 [bacterium]|jgi:ribosomal protein L29|nr:50S ribosomal protein L29 [bacterium]
MSENTITKLEKKILDKSKSLFELRMKLVSNDLKDTSKISKTKREIARLKTELGNTRKQNV